MDDAAVLSFFAENGDTAADELVAAFIGREDFFGSELKAVPGLKEKVTAYLKEIRENGVPAVMRNHFGG